MNNNRRVYRRHWVRNMGFERKQEMSHKSTLKDQFDRGENAHGPRFVQTPLPAMLHR